MCCNPDPYRPATVVETVTNLCYVIPLRISTELHQGVVIDTWQLIPPWHSLIRWDCDPRKVLPLHERSQYAEYFDSPLREVFDERRLLRRGQRIEGALCGVAYSESVPDEFRRRPMASANLLITSEHGTVDLEFPLWILRPAAQDVNRSLHSPPPSNIIEIERSPGCFVASDEIDAGTAEVSVFKTRCQGGPGGRP